MGQARRNMLKVSLKNGTVHHNVTGEHGAAKVLLAPAPAGTGIIAGCTVFATDVVVHGTVLQRDLDHVATGLVHRLLHGQGHFTRLTLAHANAAVTVADHGQGCETHDPTALDHFGHAVDRDHFFAQTVVTTFVLHFGLKFSHFLFRSA
jgi:hypothetical protein